MPPVEERIVVLEEGMKAVTQDIGEIKRGVEKLTDKIDGRPSWALLCIITFLSSTTVGLAVALATTS